MRLEVELRERGGRRREEHEERGDQSLKDEAVQWLQEYIRINTTNPLEGTNNKIKTLQRQSYGIRDPDFFRLRIYALHETRLTLVG